ncbi:hypothetical protein BURKHO8Y_150056 [Burkholderia sp. 8Y]|nr:hypothetical protein BURKHO8Y_150056 [Burkholderia sp. 8Y]
MIARASCCKLQGYDSAIPVLAAAWPVERAGRQGAEPLAYRRVLDERTREVTYLYK